jgi:Tfp pilus assembly protein PilF/ferredoxin
VAGTGSLSGVRKSTRGKWRAAVLIGLHLLIGAHAVHFLVAGRTLSPVEPSESMYTLELGFVNAGFIFFATALLATLVFGRFVCGWGCHMVALQDLCGWIMRKLGVRPRPFRSRILLWVPLLLALYMFVWPTLKRLVLEDPPTPFPGFTNHLVTTGFWDTFPGPLFAVLTLATCGLAAVWFLGSKGFCTYGCPYGGFFVLADRLSPARIVVSDACEQCGHCTATCTSNVRVHEEVRLYGMVVDPGCMKCTDCISVCPNDALSYGFARPSVFKGAPAGPTRDVRYTLTVGEELLLGVVFLASMLAFRGLYDGPPLLMAVGLGGITAFGALKLWHLYRRPTVRIQNVVLEMDGRIRPSGWIFAGLTVVWLLFTAHSGFVQWHRARGGTWLERTEASRAEVLSGAHRTRRYSERHHDAAARSFEHFGKADRWGLFDVAEVKLGLAWGHLLSNDPEAAEREVRAAIAVAPENPALHEDLFALLLGERKLNEAVEAKRRRLEVGEPTATDHFQLGGLMAETGDHEGAIEQYRACLALEEHSFEARYNLGGLLRRLERHDEAIEHLEIARDLAPNDADTRVELGLAYMATGANEKAIRELERAIELNPLGPESQAYLPGLIRELREAR